MAINLSLPSNDKTYGEPKTTKHKPMDSLIFLKISYRVQWSINCTYFIQVGSFTRPTIFKNNINRSILLVMVARLV